MKAFAVALLALVTLLVAPRPAATADDTWQPATGAVFNNPMGGVKARTKVVRQVHQAIRHTPPGATIRIATYNIDRADTARLLLEAHRRGVHVRIVVNDNIIGRTIRGLQARLGRDRRADSFLHICTSACRNSSRAGNLHMKVYSFSQTGAARSVVISSSSNLGYGAAAGQWNDALTISGDDALFAAWTQVFQQLKRDRTAKPRHLEYSSETVGADFQRVRVSRAATGDPQLRRLRRVDCAAPGGFGDGRGHSVVRVNMYAWYAGRGEALARELAAMRAEGCDIAVVGSVVSAPVVRILQRAGIPVRIADWDWGRKLSTAGDDIVFGARCYSHLKYVTVDGTFRGTATRVVWTGSENWSPPGLSSDEVTFEVHDPTVVTAYVARWQKMFTSTRITHRPGIRPTSRPCA
ncbi:phosphatidylserine/phosphatidylglycerophosphate/cardiolipin synthase family protein [Nocardioides sp. L-11A]|uniref:phospholipase D-like domain-containing protein n=1 Tax=Nocardioides sp. L-11A TaxID=3043848 RepID=UPI00249CA3A4|nr:phospholipase D-like domain-containing protein [Nocardioides sp. L-11A]